MENSRKLNVVDTNIRNVDRAVHDELRNIARARETTMSALLRPVLRKFASEQPIQDRTFKR